MTWGTTAAVPPRPATRSSRRQAAAFPVVRYARSSPTPSAFTRQPPPGRSPTPTAVGAAMPAPPPTATALISGTPETSERPGYALRHPDSRRRQWSCPAENALTARIVSANPSSRPSPAARSGCPDCAKPCSWAPLPLPSRQHRLGLRRLGHADAKDPTYGTLVAPHRWSAEIWAGYCREDATNPAPRTASSRERSMTTWSRPTRSMLSTAISIATPTSAKPQRPLLPTACLRFIKLKLSHCGGQPTLARRLSGLHRVPPCSRATIAQMSRHA